MPVSRRGFFGSALFSMGGGMKSATAEESPREFELERFFIAGFQHHDGPFLIGRMRPGDSLEVCAEFHNPYDSNAVRLEFAGRHVGYVPQCRNAVIGRLLAQRAPLRGRVVTLDAAAEPWRMVEVAVLFPASREQRP